LSQDSRRALWLGVEDVEGILANQLFMVPCMSFTKEAQDTRLRVKEMKNTRIRDGKTVRALRHMSYKMGLLGRYDLSAIPFNSLLGTPSIAAHTSSTQTTNVQTITFAGTWANADIFTLTIDGYTTQNIVYSTTAATLRTNIVTALNTANIPSVVTASNATSTDNILVGLPSGTTSGTVTLTASDNLASYAMPAITATKVSSSAGTVTVANTTPGAGAYDATFTGGGSGMPTVSAVWFDGVSFKQYLGGSANGMDITITPDGFLQFDWDMISRFELEAAPYYTITNATVATAVTVLGSNTCTPSAMTGIYPGMSYKVSSSDGSNAETVYVTSTTSTTFTAVFTKVKGSSWIITPAQVATVSSALTSTNSQTVTVSSTTYIYPGAMLLAISPGAGPTFTASNVEVITVTAVPTSTTFTAVFNTTKAANWIVVPVKVPTLVEANYNQPIDPSQLLVTFAGSAYDKIKNLKISVKANRAPLHTIGAGVDMIRATEGEFTVDYDMTARYVDYPTSEYKKFIENTLPGSIALSAVDTLTSFTGAGNPTFTMTLPATTHEKGNVDSTPAEPEQKISGYAPLDATTATNLTTLFTNQRLRYISLT